MIVCTQCGHSASVDASFCEKCGKKVDQPNKTAEVPPISSTPSFGPVGPLMMHRYIGGYHITNTLVSNGRTVKTAGAIVSGVAGLILLAVFREPFSGSITLASALPALAIAAWIYFVTWIAGTIVSALGHMNAAQLDSAVYASPFLTNEERATVIGLRANIQTPVMSTESFIGMR